MITQGVKCDSMYVGVIHVVDAQVYEWNERLRLQNLILNLLVHGSSLNRLIGPAGELQLAVQFLVMKSHIVHV